MGFFSEIASEARRGMAAPPAAPEPAPVPPVAALEAPRAQPTPTPQTPTEASTPPQAESTPSAHTPPPPEVKLTVEDTAARQAHEAAEAKRKAEFDAKQAEKKAAEQAELDKLAAMSDADAIREAAKRVGSDTEKITRRNMKDQVAQYIQALCQRDPAFARKTMHPRKNMIHCFRYISRKAFEYIQDELKADGIKPGPGSEGYGCDVPDDLVYQWAVDYFNDLDAEEDLKDDEKFVPKPYVPAAPTPRKKTQGKADKKPPKPKDEADAGQITLGGFALMGEKAG